jgi:WD40 repeat protein
MEISNKYVGFEKCLSEIQIFENDENNKQLVSGGREGYLKRWDINSGKMEKQEQLVRKELLTCITIINGHKLAIGTEFGNIIIFDYFSQKKVIFLYGFNCYINAMCYSNKSDNLFTCCKDMNIYIWNLISLKCSNAIEKPHNKNIYDIILCENDLISCSNDESINIYNIGNEEKDEQDNDKYDDFETN